MPRRKKIYKKKRKRKKEKEWQQASKQGSHTTGPRHQLKCPLNSQQTGPTPHHLTTPNTFNEKRKKKKKKKKKN